MARLKIGLSLRLLGLPLRRGLDEVCGLNISGVQLEAAGELAPARLSGTGRREISHMIKSRDLELAALSCPLRHGLDVPERLQERIDHVRQVISGAYDLGTRVVIVQAGRIPEKDDDPRAPFLIQALEALGRHGDRTGVTLALETGQEPGDGLASFLGRFDTGSLAVNFDPANLILNGFDPYTSLRALTGKIVHCHARDARRQSAGRPPREVPLGEGDIDWMLLAGTLEEIAYRGWMTIERESSDNPLAEAAAAVGFLRRILA